MSDDQRHLDLLSIFHYIVAGVLALLGCLPIVHLMIGIAMVAGAFEGGQNPPPPAVGFIFIAAALFGMALCWTMAILVFVGGRKLKARRAYTFCFIVAAVLCIFMPFGTVLGVFTIVVLTRPSAKALFTTTA